MLSSNTPVPAQSFFKVADMADVVGISRTAAYQLVRSGEISSVKILGATRVPRGAILKFIEEMEASASRAQSLDDLSRPS
jgi:excisionase family DNA binding protein